MERVEDEANNTVILRCEPLRRASKDGCKDGACGPSFEARKKERSPQDDGGERGGTGECDGSGGGGRSGRGGSRQAPALRPAINQ
jgi:hypothetical protein